MVWKCQRGEHRFQVLGLESSMSDIDQMRCQFPGQIVRSDPVQRNEDHRFLKLMSSVAEQFARRAGQRGMRREEFVRDCGKGDIGVGRVGGERIGKESADGGVVQPWLELGRVVPTSVPSSLVPQRSAPEERDPECERNYEIST